jgi:hypothetical protein
MVKLQSSAPILEINNLDDLLISKPPYIMDTYLSDDKLISNSNDEQTKFDQCKIVRSITVEINKDFSTENHMIKYLKFTNPELIKTVEFLISNQVINQWHSDFTNFNEPVPIILGLHNNAIFGVYGLEYMRCTIRVTKHDNNILSYQDDITCILDLYEDSNLGNKKINELVILQNMYTHYLEKQCCFQLSYLPTTRFTVKFTTKNQDQKMIIDKVIIKLTINDTFLLLSLTKNDEKSWIYDFTSECNDYKNKLPSLSKKYKAELIIDGSNYSCQIEQTVCNVLRFLNGMAGMAYV